MSDYRSGWMVVLGDRNGISAPFVPAFPPKRPVLGGADGWFAAYGAHDTETAATDEAYDDWLLRCEDFCENEDGEQRVKIDQVVEVRVHDDGRIDVLDENGLETSFVEAMDVFVGQFAMDMPEPAAPSAEPSFC